MQLQIMVIGVVTSLLAASPEAQPSEPPHAPRTQWQIDGGETYCSVVRTPASTSEPQLILRHYALGLGGDVFVVDPDLPDRVPSRTEFGMIVDGETFPVVHGVIQQLADGRRALQLGPIMRFYLNKVQAARSVEIRRGDDVLTSSAINSPAGIGRMLDECRRNALEEAGIDADIDRDGVWQALDDSSFRSTSPANPANWVQPGDYPFNALRGEVGGRVGVLVVIGPSGAISRCIVGVSSGRRDLDEATCSAVIRRGRYPAYGGSDRLARLWFNWAIAR